MNQQSNGYVRGSPRRLSLRLSLGLGLAVVVLFGGYGAYAIITDLTIVRQIHEGRAEHADQHEFLELVEDGHDEEAFTEAFEIGDELFEAVFNAIDGGGAKVGKGQRFTRVPRADLDGAGEWARHTPPRATGPNAEACNQCHNLPFDDGAGGAQANVHRDPTHSGSLGSMIQRNTPHVFAPGAVQRVAEEMTEALHAIRDAAKAHVCQHGGSATRHLSFQGVSFGAIKATRTSSSPCRVSFDTSGVRGVDTDLVVRPFQWKGAVASLRDFNRGASHNELGMQAVELVGDGVDGDFDGVANEMTVGDQTALSIYLAAQPRPTSTLELSALGLLDPPLTQGQINDIVAGFGVFDQIHCDSCHKPVFTLQDPIFSEPSQNPNYRDSVFPAGQNPLSKGLDPDHPVSFDLTKDQPDNRIEDANGNLVYHLGAFPKDGSGRALVPLFGDLKRHDMGSGLAESIDEIGTGRSVFLTENLWGVGSTAPYMHDGRATTLTEAILEHGGEASTSKSSFVSLSVTKKRQLVAFLDSLVLFKIPEE